MSTLAHARPRLALPGAVDPAPARLALRGRARRRCAQSIWIILDTEPGERIMRPTFGCGLRRYLMEPNTVARARADPPRRRARARRLGAAHRASRRVDVAPGDDPALVRIAIAYVHVRDGRPDNLVYPFYLE